MIAAIRRGVGTLGLFIGIVFSQGCATVATLGGQDQQVTITSTPPGAAVIVDGQPAGTTPAIVKLSRRSEHNVEIAASGHETAQVTIRRHLNPWMLGNIVVGGFIGLAVDVISDASHTLSPDELNVVLRPIEPLPSGETISVPVPPQQ